MDRAAAWSNAEAPRRGKFARLSRPAAGPIRPAQLLRLKYDFDLGPAGKYPQERRPLDRQAALVRY
jgi:hypothetical protein